MDAVTAGLATAEDAEAYGPGVLRGSRVRLRPLQEADVPVLDAWWALPEWQGLQQSTVRPRPPGSFSGTVRRWSANDDRQGVGFSVAALGGEGLVGHVTLWGARLPERDAHLAVLIGPDHVGRGYGTDAVRVLIRYGFLVMGLNRIQLEVYAYNTRARRAYARAGFVEEGTRRDAVFIDGSFADEVVMSVLRREWAG